MVGEFISTELMAMIVAVFVLILIIIVLIAQIRSSRQNVLAVQARESTEHDQTITLVNNFTDAVFSTDSAGIITIYNSAALDLLDTNEQIEGRFISDLIKLKDTDDQELDVFKELTKNNSIRKRDDLIMQLDEDDKLRLEATFAPVQGNSITSDSPDSYVLILRDITRMKSLEEERNEFISVVSHELRTPVTIAEGSLSNAKILLQRGAMDKIAQAIDDAHSQTIFLAKMVNDLSTLSRAERGASDQPELIDITELAHQLHTEYSPQAEAKGLAFNLDIVGQPGKLTISRLYLQELLQNLITNAIKYTPSGSVTLKIEPDDEQTCFSVIDTGIGIGKADQQRIFQRFYRAEDFRTRETNGTGLGLYVAAKLAKKLGCDIDVSSRLNHGSTFSFTIKTAKPQV